MSNKPIKYQEHNFSFYNQLFVFKLGTCQGDSGASFWKTVTKDGNSVSTVLGVLSYGADTCGGSAMAHKIGHKDVLEWISHNWIRQESIQKWTKEMSLINNKQENSIINYLIRR